MTMADKEGTLHVIIFFNYRGGPIQKRFTNFHAKGKKVVMENHLYFVLK